MWWRVVRTVFGRLWSWVAVSYGIAFLLVRMLRKETMSSAYRAVEEGVSGWQSLRDLWHMLSKSLVSLGLLFHANSKALVDEFCIILSVFHVGLWEVGIRRGMVSLVTWYWSLLGPVYCLSTGTVVFLCFIAGPWIKRNVAHCKGRFYAIARELLVLGNVTAGVIIVAPQIGWISHFGAFFAFFPILYGSMILLGNLHSILPIRKRSSLRCPMGDIAVSDISPEDSLKNIRKTTNKSSGNNFFDPDEFSLSPTSLERTNENKTEIFNTSLSQSTNTDIKSDKSFINKRQESPPDAKELLALGRRLQAALMLWFLHFLYEYYDSISSFTRHATLGNTGEAQRSSATRIAQWADYAILGFCIKAVILTMMSTKGDLTLLGFADALVSLTDRATLRYLNISVIRNASEYLMTCPNQIEDNIIVRPRVNNGNGFLTRWLPVDRWPWTWTPFAQSQRFLRLLYVLPLLVTFALVQNYYVALLVSFAMCNLEPVHIVLTTLFKPNELSHYASAQLYLMVLFFLTNSTWRTGYPRLLTMTLLATRVCLQWLFC